MNRARSSLDQKPPLAVSPRRLRPRRVLRSDAAAPAPSPRQGREPRRSYAPEESTLLREHENISRELRALTKGAKEDFAGGDTLETIAQLADGYPSPLFERGRLYEVYSARRNERLKRKLTEETAVGELPACHFSADAEVGKRKSTKRTEGLRRSAPENFLAGPAATLRSSLRSSHKQSETATLPRRAVKDNAEGERRSSLRSSRKN